MIKLIIDDIPVEVPEGTTVLEAAQSVGIPIPHFCYHPALGKAGACRVCAVKMVEGPVKGIQMSCMLDAQDGMVVSTTDEEAMAMRRQVIEWLMINHPHDCPVCDEGGECQLQDFTIAGGHGIRRYTGTKRTYRNQFLGPYIEHEMNRCIQCYRCVRFYQEYAGGDDFGVMGCAGRIYYGRFEDGMMESPFSGNILDLCPTGVFTDKTARFRARYWDYDMAPSVCPHCSLGCNTIPAARYRELLKVVARRNDEVNGWFICDRGRFTNGAVNHAERPRYPQIDRHKVPWKEALDHLHRNLSGIVENHGSDSLAIVGSSRLTQEAATLLHQLRDAVAPGGSLCYFASDAEADRGAMAVSYLNENTAASMGDVRAADMIVVAYCDLLQEGPMMALAVRQAWRQGARIFLVEEGQPQESEIRLPFAWIHAESLADIPFDEAQRPVVICGIGVKAEKIIPKVFEQEAKLAWLLGGPNEFGAALLAQEHRAISLERAALLGKVKGIIAVEADIAPDLLEKIPFVAALDWRSSDTVRAARIVLPTASWVEMDGTFINNEGRAQRFDKVMNPGLPIKGLSPELHPPRRHIARPPGGDLHPAWKVIQNIAERWGASQDMEPLTGKWQKLQTLGAETEGRRIYRSTK